MANHDVFLFAAVKNGSWFSTLSVRVRRHVFLRDGDPLLKGRLLIYPYDQIVFFVGDSNRSHFVHGGVNVDNILVSAAFSAFRKKYKTSKKFIFPTKKNIVCKNKMSQCCVIFLDTFVEIYSKEITSFFCCFFVG